jgi:hypothetical protein
MVWKLLIGAMGIQKLMQMMTHSDLVVFCVWLTMFCMMNGGSMNNMIYVCLFIYEHMYGVCFSSVHFYFLFINFFPVIVFTLRIFC